MPGHFSSKVLSGSPQKNVGWEEGHRPVRNKAELEKQIDSIRGGAERLLAALEMVKRHPAHRDWPYPEGVREAMVALREVLNEPEDVPSHLRGFGAYKISCRPCVRRSWYVPGVLNEFGPGGEHPPTCEKCGIAFTLGWPAEDQRVQVAAVLVINQLGELLLAERVGRAEFKGLYDTPGGKARYGESLFAAAQRELRDETQLWLPVERFEYWGRAEYRSETAVPLDVHYLVVRATAEGFAQAEPHKHGPWEWKTRAWVNENAERMMPSLRPPGVITRWLAGA